MNTLKKLIGIIFISIILNSCGKQNGKPKNFDYGKVRNNVYTNTYFNLEMDVPTDWVVQDKEQRRSLMNKGSNLIEDENVKAIIKASEISSANLFIAFQHEVGAAVDFNASISIVVESTKDAPGIKTGADYLFHTKKLLNQMTLKYDYVSEDFKKENISGVDFYKMDLELNLLDLPIKQRYYTTVINGFSMGIIISYQTKEQEEILLKSIQSIKM